MATRIDVCLSELAHDMREHGQPSYWPYTKPWEQMLCKVRERVRTDMSEFGIYWRCQQLTRNRNKMSSLKFPFFDVLKRPCPRQFRLVGKDADSLVKMVDATEIPFRRLAFSREFQAICENFPLDVLWTWRNIVMLERSYALQDDVMTHAETRRASFGLFGDKGG